MILIEQFKLSEAERDEIADSILYTEKKAGKAKDLQFITRIQNLVKPVAETTPKALSCPTEKQTLDDGRVMQSFNVEHYGMKQRWHVGTEETEAATGCKTG